MNKIILLGRLTKDPEVRYTQSQKVVTCFTLAVDRPFNSPDGKKEADFINVVTWNKTAEVVGNNVHKGQRLLVEGRLQIRNYEGKDGAKRYATEVIADRVEFIEHKEKNGESGQSGDFSAMGTAVPFDEVIPF
jgi:single-strand binding protein